MSDSTKSESTTSKGPSHVAYQVRDREGQKGFWTRIGAAWKHKDGEGFNLQLDLVPVAGGRIVLRVPNDDQEKGA